MVRLKSLQSTPRGRFLSVLGELVLVGGLALLGQHWVARIRALHTARAQSQRDCSPGAPNACPPGATCELWQGVARCAGEFEDAQSLWQEARAWVGRRVVVRHARVVPEVDGYYCTQMACAWNNPCCNSCQARAQLENAGFSELVNVDCTGNECEEPQCGIEENIRSSPDKAVSYGTVWRLIGDVELHGKVRDDGGALSIEDVSVNGHVAPKRDIFGRPLE